MSSNKEVGFDPKGTGLFDEGYDSTFSFLWWHFTAAFAVLTQTTAEEVDEGFFVQIWGNLNLEGRVSNLHRCWTYFFTGDTSQYVAEHIEHTIFPMFQSFPSW